MSCPEIAIHKKYPNGKLTRTTLREANPKRLFYVFSFMNIHKYPPSLLYMCVTIGGALLLLPHLEKLENQFSKIMIVFGRTAFFYYILHLFYIHFLAMISFYIQGHSLAENAETESVFK